MATMKNLNDLYIEELKDIYNAELQITQALPKMINATKHSDLKKAFQTHLQQTQQHIQRLEQIFTRLNERGAGKLCKGMQGLIQEGEELIKSRADSDVLDAALIGAAQRVEHYEIAAYGTARTYARLLGYADDARLLQTTLDEEGETDHLLTALAERSINREAALGE